MNKVLCQGSMLKCSYGATSAPLNVLPSHRVFTQSMPAANIMDTIPMTNIPSFGTCSSMANPTVAAATAAAMGTLTPMPCVPVTAAPWTPGNSKVLLANIPLLTQQSKCHCSWGGVIEAVTTAQTTVEAT